MSKGSGSSVSSPGAGITSAKGGSPNARAGCDWGAGAECAGVACGARYVFVAIEKCAGDEWGAGDASSAGDASGAGELCAAGWNFDTGDICAVTLPELCRILFIPDIIN